MHTAARLASFVIVSCCTVCCTSASVSATLIRHRSELHIRAAKTQGAPAAAPSDVAGWLTYMHSLSCLQDIEAGLGLLLFPEWYSLDAMARMRFFDDNTRTWWTAATGGSNIPAVNDLVAPYGLAFSSAVLHGSLTLGPHKIAYASGTSLLRAPRGAAVFGATLQDKARASGNGNAADRAGSYDVLAVVKHGNGTVAAFGDASCVDSSHATSNCHAMLLDLFRFAAAGQALPWRDALRDLPEDLTAPDEDMPKRPDHDLLQRVSYVLSHNATCLLNSAVGAAAARAQQTPVRSLLVPPGREFAVYFSAVQCI